MNRPSLPLGHWFTLVSSCLLFGVYLPGRQFVGVLIPWSHPQGMSIPLLLESFVSSLLRLRPTIYHRHRRGVQGRFRLYVVRPLYV